MWTKDVQLSTRVRVCKVEPSSCCRGVCRAAARDEIEVPSSLDTTSIGSNNSCTTNMPESFGQSSSSSSSSTTDLATDRRPPQGGCDGVVCLLGCLMAVPGVKKRIVNSVAFFPPCPPGYYLSDTGKALLCSRSSSPFPEPIPDLSTALGITVETVTLHTVVGNELRAFHFKKTAAGGAGGDHAKVAGSSSSSSLARKGKTIIFSHGNSTDIGLMFPHLRDIAAKCDVSVLAYDYSGYGCSTGEPSERNLYADIQAAFLYLNEECNIPMSQIILYGQSVGSAPSIHLANELQHGLGGLILHSALKSGLAVVYSKIQHSPWYDVFQNVHKIKEVDAPVFLIHGTADLEVPIDHGKALYEACLRPFPPWWVHEGGHNDIEVIWRATFFTKIRGFLDSLE
ncbi:unnamed protein product [Amoebophrya sp. A120]|nr:unnamed protein product [Amoebophrya sp. A120]|eukprot:GSA120T00019296001.1